MKSGSTFFLKTLIVLFGASVLAVCIFLLPQGILSDQTGAYRPILLGMYVPAVPFFIALYQAWKILRLVDVNKAFSDLSVKALGVIKYCGVVIGGMYVLGMPYIYKVADLDDAPGVVVIALVIVFASSTIAAAAALFEAMMQNAVDMKKENDLTV